MTVRLELSNTSGIAHTGPTSYEFTDGPVRIGRASKSELVLDGQVISRVHVLLDVVHGAWHATHEGRMTPSVLNGVPLEPGRPTRLTDGDQLVVGDYELQIGIPDDSFVPELDPLSSVATFPGSETRTTAQGMPDAAPEWETSTPGPPDFAGGGRAAPPGPSGRATPTLVVVKGTNEPLQLELTEVGRPYVIGRANTCDLTLGFNAISRQHAQVRFDGTVVYVRDMGSRNPLRVNGRPLVGETPLEHGATIGLGPIELRLSLESGIGGRVAAETMMGDQTAYEAPPPPAAPPPQPQYRPPPPPPAPPAPPPTPPAAAPDWDAPAPMAPGGGAAWENDSGGFGGPAPLPIGFDDAPAPKDPPPPPAWGGGAPPPAPAAPGPGGGPDFGGAGGGAPAAPPPPAWGGPPPVAPIGMPPPAVPPVAPAGGMPPAAMPGGFPGAPPGGLPPPAPPGGLPPPGVSGGLPPPAIPGMPPVAPTGAAEPKVVARQSPSGKGWLLAGSLSMAAAVILGVIFILLTV